MEYVIKILKDRLELDTLFYKNNIIHAGISERSSIAIKYRNEIIETEKALKILLKKQETSEKAALNISDVINWVEFDYNVSKKKPNKYGKYLIVRKDGKMHWETWNGSGWAYNHTVIKYWAIIKPPCL